MRGLLPQAHLKDTHHSIADAASRKAFRAAFKADGVDYKHALISDAQRIAEKLPESLKRFSAYDVIEAIDSE